MTSGWANARPSCHTRCTSACFFSRHARFTQRLGLLANLRLAEHFGALDANGQPRAPFGAPRFEYIPSAGGTHFAAEPVHAQTM